MSIANLRTVITAAAAIALAGLSVPVAAQTQSNIAGSGGQGTVATAATPARQSADQGRRICVRAELTGTRVTRNICRTQAEWDRAGGLPRADD